MDATLINVDLGNYYLPNTPTQIDLSSLFSGGSFKSTASYMALDKAEKSTLNAVIGEIGKIAQPGKLFVTDTNCAHQISFFLAQSIYNQYISGKSMAVINFDQHFDYDAPRRQKRQSLGKSEISCGNWGCFLSPTIDYAAVFVASVRGREDDCDSASIVLAQDIPNKNNDVEKFGHILASNNRFYISVDMDVITGYGRTNWEDGAIKKEQLIGALTSLFDNSKNVELMGADITGLPPKTSNNAKNFGKYLEDVEIVAGVLNELLKKYPYKP